MPQYYVGKVISVLPLGGGVGVLQTPFLLRVTFDMYVKRVTQKIIRVTPNIFEPMTLHTIPDGFFAPARKPYRIWPLFSQHT